MDLDTILAITGTAILIVVMIFTYIHIIAVCRGSNGAARLRREQNILYTDDPENTIPRINVSSSTDDVTVYAKTARNYVHADSFQITIE